MEPRENIIRSMNLQELYQFFDSFSTEGSEVQFNIKDQIFKGQPSSDPKILENLRAAIIRANELGLTEVLGKQISKIQGLCGDLLLYTEDRVEIDSKNQFEIDLAKAEAGEFIPACYRLALFICRNQNSALFSDNAGTVTEKKFKPPKFENTTPLTREEIALLYNDFILGIENILHETNKDLRNFGSTEPFRTLETMFINWYVDYAPNCELASILTTGLTKIQMRRKATSEPKLQPGWGLVMSSLYHVKDGCAMFRNHVIDHTGKLLEEDPWKTFYRTEDPSDERRAKELCPNMSQEMKISFENRKIIRALGYTFAENATTLCVANNWGVVDHLIEEEGENISHPTGFQVLKLAVNANQWRTCKKLFHAGLPIYETSRSVSYDTPFFLLIQKCEPGQLTQILKETKVPNGSFDSFKKIIPFLCNRYRENELDDVEGQLFQAFLALWTTSMHPEYENFFDIPSDVREKSHINLYRDMVSHLDDQDVHLRDTIFEQQIRDPEFDT